MEKHFTCSWCTADTRGVCNRTTSERILVIYEFAMSTRFYDFSQCGYEFKNKRIIDHVLVRVWINNAGV